MFQYLYISPNIDHLQSDQKYHNILIQMQRLCECNNKIRLHPSKKIIINNTNKRRRRRTTTTQQQQQNKQTNNNTARKQKQNKNSNNNKIETKTNLQSSPFSFWHINVNEVTCIFHSFVKIKLCKSLVLTQRVQSIFITVVWSDTQLLFGVYFK